MAAMHEPYGLGAIAGTKRIQEQNVNVYGKPTSHIRIWLVALSTQGRVKQCLAEGNWPFASERIVMLHQRRCGDHA